MKLRFAAMLSAAVLGGCTTGSSHRFPGTDDAGQHDWREVKIVQTIPPGAHEVGSVNSKAMVLWSQAAAEARATKELQKQAAKLGANVVLTQKPELETLYTDAWQGVVSRYNPNLVEDGTYQEWHTHNSFVTMDGVALLVK